MGEETSAAAQRLMNAMLQFKRLGQHPPAFGGCKPGEMRVLFCIKHGISQSSPTMKVSEISKRLLVTSPLITQLLKRLEANGLIKKHMDTSDKRAVGIGLTEKGEQVTVEAENALLAKMKGLAEHLGAEDSTRLADLLFKVFRYFSEQEAMCAYQLRVDEGEEA
jgi:DNA-binding MarR family transcriptional regulator